MKPLLLTLVCGSLVACQGRSDLAQQGGLYQYVHAQGNLVTMQRPPTHDADKSLPSGAIKLEPVPAEVLDDTQESYLSDAEVDKLLENRERDRMISYVDSSGYRITQSFDVVDAREKREAERQARYDSLGNRVSNFIERLEGVPQLCCRAPLKAAQTLKAGEEQLLSFATPPWQWVIMPASHPAVALKLAADIHTLRVQSFLQASGYVHPQAVFLDRNGIPLLLVDNIFARHFPEAWHRFAYLEGDIEVDEEARWVVFYLGYATQSGQGRPELVPGDYPWADPSAPLGLQGELVVRGLSHVLSPMPE